MKSIVSIAFFLVLAVFVAAAYWPANVSKNGIHFYQGTLAEAIKKSKQENKPVFVDVSASWCGYCKKLKRNGFSDKEVGSYFNDHFINVSIDGERGEGPSVAKQYNVQGYPTLFVLDKEGNVLLYSSGYMDKEQLLNFALAAVKKLTE